MEDTFFPSRRLASIFTIITTILLSVFGLFMLFSNRLADFGASAYFLKTLGGLLILLAVWGFYRFYAIVNTRYRVNRNYLEVRWGFNKLLIPMHMIQWARSVSEFETPLPLPFLPIPGSYYGQRKIAGLGSTRFIATEKREMVLVKCTEFFLVLSPKSAKAFVDAYERMIEFGTLQKEEPAFQDIASLWQRVRQDKPTRQLLSLSWITLFLFWILVIVFYTLFPTITWPSLEVVSSVRLFLLAGIATFFVAFNSLLGVILYLSGLKEKHLIFMLWGTSILVCVVLGAAILIMVL